MWGEKEYEVFEKYYKGKVYSDICVEDYCVYEGDDGMGLVDGGEVGWRGEGGGGVERCIKGKVRKRVFYIGREGIGLIVGVRGVIWGI